MNEILVAPSMLSADFTRMGEDVRRMEEAGADMLHLDIMDGLFVPNISFGPKMVADIRKRTRLPLDVHLMIVDPERYIDAFVRSGADYITVHYEATEKPAECLETIKKAGVKCGIVISPDTPAGKIFDLLPQADMALVMSVYPGFGGQKFIPSALGKLRELAAKIGELGLDTRLEIDGGVGADNAGEIKRAGADTLVAGSAVFNAPSAAAAIEALKRA